ncbi:Zn-finger protein [Ceratobasidium sp. AG-Ba]|nr:Zn-finger protein [Ceratobasidium sp. AG-Ba]
MGRKGTLYARALRRTARLLQRLPTERGRVIAHYGPPAFTCPYCSRTLKTASGRERHIVLQAYCRTRRLRELSGFISKYLEKKRRKLLNTASPKDAPLPHEAAPSHDTPAHTQSEKRPYSDLGGETSNPSSPKRQRIECSDAQGGHPVPRQPSCSTSTSGTGSTSGSNACRSSGSPAVDYFPIPTAGTPISDKKKPSMLTKEDLRDYLASCGPMGEQERFEVAELLMTTGLTGKNRTRYLTSCLAKGKRLWKKNRELLKDIDRLPYGPKWTEQKLTVGEGIYRRTHTLFRRNIIELVQELLGDPQFKGCMRYAPEHQWTSKKRICRSYGEMWSGNWWWRMQWMIGDPNGTVVPLIIASDKTTLSTMAGGQQAYPVYLTIGNISKNIRRKASKRATIILGYLPVDSFKDVTDKGLRTKLRGELLHRSMEVVMEPLKTASRVGVPMWCADGYLRRAYPILAVFVGDWPEQNNMSCTVRSGCPVCEQRFHGRGSGKTACMRSHKETEAAFQAYEATGNKSELKGLNLKPWKPFWLDLPNVHFPSCITPDILHQLHKGVFKDYVAEWTKELLGEAELNKRFMAMPKAKDLRHFKSGITTVSQWTGRETKEMVKQYLPIVAEDPNVPDEFVRMVRALLDFLYLAEQAQLSEDDVKEMEQALQTFHSLKGVLVELELMLDISKFDYIPKFHMLSHYAHSIRELGTPDGYNTESPEHLHIIYAKRGWRVSNRREAICQIITYVQRLEAIRIQQAYIDEYYGELSHPKPQRDIDGDGLASDDEDADGDRNSDDDDGDVVEDALNLINEEIDHVMEGVPDSYPRPSLGVAVQPTRRSLTGHHLVSSYGATDLVRSLTRFLKPLARGSGFPTAIFLSDTFDVWHKLTLTHRPIFFAQDEPLHHDVICIRPPSVDQSGRHVPGLFDTILFLHRPLAVGLQRYRAGRVRAIFTLPPRLQSLYPGRL